MSDEIVAQPKFACRRVFNNDQIIKKFDDWLLICGKAANTRINYTFTARQFAKFLDKPLTSATKEDVRVFLFELYSRGLAPTTIQSRLDALRVLFDCLQLGGQVRASVPRFLLRRKLPKRLPAARSEEEIERLIAAASCARDRAAIELDYASGLRAAELVKLNVEDVNLRARSLIVRQGKGGGDRIALFGRRAAAALREYLGDRKTGPVFVSQPRRQRGSVSRQKDGAWWGYWREPDASGKKIKRGVRLGDFEIPTKERAREALDNFLTGKLPNRAAPSLNRLGKRDLGRIITKTAKRAGLTGVHPHTLRHSMATHCLNRGMNIRFVQELLGHTSLMATQKYLHAATEDLKRVHTKFLVRG